MSAAVRLSELMVCAADERRLLDGVSLAVPEKGVHGLIGANGAGKTTLLRTLLGVQALRSGEVEIAGRPLAAWASAQLAAHVGYLPQHIECHWDFLVSEILTLRCPWISEKLIERCRVRALLGRHFATLSGGEQARVVLARALAHSPRLVLADEPAASLDLPQQHEMLSMLREFACDCAVVVVLHDLHLASRYCDSLTVLAGGRVVKSGIPAEVLREDLLQQAYGAPICALTAGGFRYFSMP